MSYRSRGCTGSYNLTYRRNKDRKRKNQRFSSAIHNALRESFSIFHVVEKQAIYFQ
jgi:hypothetical protein